MMETICRNFLQLFLVGVMNSHLIFSVGCFSLLDLIQMNSFTMNFAVHSLIPMHPNETVEEYNKKNATKVALI